MATRAAASSYRLRPTSRSRTRSRSRIHWDKLGRVALVLVLIAILASYVGPLINFVGAWQDRRQAATELTQLRHQYENLHARAAAAAGPDPAGAAARKLGMVSPGERSYAIQDLKR